MQFRRQGLGLDGLRQRLFAWLSTHRGTYEERMALRKRALFGRLHGDILKLGPGTGPNIRYYAADVHWIGVEPNVFMHPYLVHAVRALGRPMENYRIVQGEPQGIRLPAEDASMDGVVGTLVLCSLPRPEAALQEILRILKPGGRFVFIEHVAAPQGTGLRTWQDLIQPLWTLLADGCHPNRETWAMLDRAKFANLEIEHFLYPDAGPEAPHIAGEATKSTV
jgi:SAM-dependent methyltransferase